MKFKDYFKVGDFFSYFFRKKDPNRPKNINLRMMHFVNRLAIIMFLIGIGILIYKLFIR